MLMEYRTCSDNFPALSVTTSPRREVSCGALQPIASAVVGRGKMTEPRQRTKSRYDLWFDLGALAERRGDGSCVERRRGIEQGSEHRPGLLARRARKERLLRFCVGGNQAQLGLLFRLARRRRNSGTRQLVFRSQPA